MADLSGLTLLAGHYDGSPGDTSAGAARRHGRRNRIYAAPVSSGRAPQPIVLDVRHLTWKLRAACLDADPEMFFDEEQDIEPLRRICQGCPAIDDCRAYATEHKLVGFWANTTDADRRRARTRARRRARQAAAQEGVA